MIKKSVDMPNKQAYRWDRLSTFLGVGGYYTVSRSPWQREGGAL
jgi:hypothetical protein